MRINFTSPRTMLRRSRDEALLEYLKGEWKPWFAWFPVMTKRDGVTSISWFEKIERKVDFCWICFFQFDYVYRTIKEGDPKFTPGDPKNRAWLSGDPLRRMHPPPSPRTKPAKKEDQP